MAPSDGRYGGGGWAAARSLAVARRRSVGGRIGRRRPAQTGLACAGRLSRAGCSRLVARRAAAVPASETPQCPQNVCSGVSCGRSSGADDRARDVISRDSWLRPRCSVARSHSSAHGSDQGEHGRRRDQRQQRLRHARRPSSSAAATTATAGTPNQPRAFRSVTGDRAQPECGRGGADRAAAITGWRTPSDSSWMSQGSGSPAAEPRAEQLAAPGNRVRAGERDRRRCAERGAIEDVVEALLRQQEERPGDHQQRPRTAAADAVEQDAAVSRCAEAGRRAPRARRRP